MIGPFPPKSRFVGVAGAFGLLAALATVAARAPAIVMINESPSLPKGLYARAPAAALKLGAVVAIPQPAAARPYLAALGMPAEVRLLKRIAAAGGDRVCATPGRVATPAASVAVLTHDRRGEPLPAWRSCRALAPGEVFLLGDTPLSFDSRYFGPVRRAAVDGVYREIVTW